MRRPSTCLVVPLLCGLLLAACGGEDPRTATVSLRNDFGATPPWTVCQAWYNGVAFDRVPPGATSAPREVQAGLGPVYLVGAWADPDCRPEHCLPLATRNDEEVVPGQQRTISLTMQNHQGPCPPEGVAPIPEALYGKVLALWPQYGFRPYAERTTNPQCVK